MLNIPTKVICKGNKILNRSLKLTLNKTYNIYDYEIMAYDLYIAVVNDDGVKEFFPIELFEEAFHITKENLAEVNVENFDRWVTNLIKL